jgi:hypothetical protein
MLVIESRHRSPGVQRQLKRCRSAALPRSIQRNGNEDFGEGNLRARSAYVADLNTSTRVRTGRNDIAARDAPARSAGTAASRNSRFQPTSADTR